MGVEVYVWEECAGGSWRINSHCRYIKPNILGNEAKILLVQRGDARIDTLTCRSLLSPTKIGVLQVC